MSSRDVAGAAGVGSHERCEISVGWSAGVLIVDVDGFVDRIAAGALADVARCADGGAQPGSVVVKLERAAGISADAWLILHRAGLVPCRAPVRGAG